MSESRSVSPAKRFIETSGLYFRYTKPRVWLLLVFTAGIGGIVAVPDFTFHSISMVMLAIVSTILGASGAEAVTNYIDKDMDSIMSRTKNRPLAKGEIEPLKALSFGIVLIIASLTVLVAFGKIYAMAFMAIGIFDNVIIYSYFLKKKTPWSIVLGGFSGGFPVIVGWYSVTTLFSYLPWFLFALVVIWIPIHVWSLAYRYKDDYAKANVPMLPVLYSDKVSAWCISGSALILIVFSLIPSLFGFQTVYYMLIALILSIPMVAYSLHFIRHPDNKNSFRLFKYSSPYLAIIFMLFVFFKFF